MNSQYSCKPGLCSSTIAARTNLSILTETLPRPFQKRTRKVSCNFKSTSNKDLQVAIDDATSLDTKNAVGDQDMQGNNEIYPPGSYPAPIDVQRPANIPWEDIILFQAFDWESSKKKDWYQTVKDRVPEISQLGATHIWLPPPSKSVAKEGYLPSDLYNIDSAYGTYNSLVSLNSALLTSNLFPMADIVINHRCADKQNNKGIWNNFLDDTPHPGHRINWGPEAITSNDPDFEGRGAADTGEDFGPSPDLDHSNPLIQEGLIDWLHWLNEYIGFEGFRFDYAKGYAAEYSKLYIEKSLQAGKNFCVAEYWVDAQWNGSTLEYNQDHMRQKLCDWLDAAKYCAAFDFPTKAILQEAVRHCQYDRLSDKDGKPPGLLGWWQNRAVTFIDNHDTGSTQQHWPFPKKGVLQGYAYILTHPGIPCIFWEHYFDWKLSKEINELVALRKRNGIHADSAVQILAAEPDMYVAQICKTLILKLGPRYDMGGLLPKKEEGWKMALSGDDWAIWEQNS